jgi:hypothetical protein
VSTSAPTNGPIQEQMQQDYATGLMGAQRELLRWARQLFPQELIQAKIEEVEQLLRLLQTPPASAAGD